MWDHKAVRSQMTRAVCNDDFEDACRKYKPIVTVVTWYPKNSSYCAQAEERSKSWTYTWWICCSNYLTSTSVESNRGLFAMWLRQHASLSWEACAGKMTSNRNVTWVTGCDKGTTQASEINDKGCKVKKDQLVQGHCWIIKEFEKMNEIYSQWLSGNDIHFILIDDEAHDINKLSLIKLDLLWNTIFTILIGTLHFWDTLKSKQGTIIF